MTQEEEIAHNIKKARKMSHQAKVMSMMALIISIVAFAIRKIAEI